MRIDLLRGMFLCVFAFLAQGAFAHGLVQDPPARNWFCGASTKPDHVQNGVAQYPVCGGRIFRARHRAHRRLQFHERAHAHHRTRGRRPAHQRLRFQFRNLERRRHGMGSAHRLADGADDRGSAQFRLEHLLGSALLGLLGFPLLDHEAGLRVADGPRAVILGFRGRAVLRPRVQRRDAERQSEPHSRQGQCTLHDALHGARAQRPARDLRRVGPHTADVRTLPRLHRRGSSPALRRRPSAANIVSNAERHHVHRLGLDRAQRHRLGRAAISAYTLERVRAESVALHHHQSDERAGDAESRRAARLPRM